MLYFKKLNKVIYTLLFSFLITFSYDLFSQNEIEEVEEIIVTGSRIKRTDVQGALPTIVITKEDIDASGFRSVTMVVGDDRVREFNALLNNYNGKRSCSRTGKSE